MSAQESIAAALGEHMLAPPGSSLSRWRCAFCDWEGDSFDSHLAAVAMDAARAAVEALDTYGLADLGRSFGHGWNSCHAAVLDLLTPPSDTPARSGGTTGSQVAPTPTGDTE